MRNLTAESDLNFLFQQVNFYNDYDKAHMFGDIGRYVFIAVKIFI